MTITIAGSGTITGLTSGGLPDETVTSSELASSAVTTAKIADANITQAKLETLVVPLGVGQTWTDVTGSRSGGTTYTNTTGRPIFVSIALANTTTSYTVTINGLTAFRIQSAGTTGGNGTASFVVPVNNTYSTNVNAVAWYELR